MPSSQPAHTHTHTHRCTHDSNPTQLSTLPLNGVRPPLHVSVSYVKEYLGVSVSPASVSLQSVVDGQQKLISEKEAEIAALKRRVEALERAAADNSTVAASTTAAHAVESGSVSGSTTSRQAPTSESTKS